MNLTVTRTLAALSLLCAFALPAGAAVINVQFEGFRFDYERVEGTDPTTGSPVVTRTLREVATPGLLGSQLEHVGFYVDDTRVAELNAPGDVAFATLDATVEEILNEVNTVDVSTPVPGLANFQVSFDAAGTQTLELAILDAVATFVPYPTPYGDPVGGVFMLAANQVQIVSGSLPFGLELTDNDQLMLSITGYLEEIAVDDAGEIITGFEAHGPGFVAGVPEPASLAIAAAGLALVVGRRR